MLIHLGALRREVALGRFPADLLPPGACWWTRGRRREPSKSSWHALLVEHGVAHRADELSSLALASAKPWIDDPPSFLRRLAKWTKRLAARFVGLVTELRRLLTIALVESPTTDAEHVERDRDARDAASDLLVGDLVAAPCAPPPGRVTRAAA